MAAVALCGYGLLSTGAPAKTARVSAVGLDATAPPLPAGNPAEGHSPRLQRELSGPLTGTGTARPGSAVRMSTSMRAATAAAASTMLNGVDVSSFQHPNGAAINWANVAAAGYRFAAIKATEGNYYVNKYYAKDAADAVAAGMYVAAYHFANPRSSNGTPTAQADYAVKNAGNYKVGGHYLPLGLDLEYDPYTSNECYGLSPSQMVSWISAFMTEAKRLTGAAPIIYTPRDWWDACTGNSTAFGGDVLWVPAYSAGTPGTLPAGWNTWTMWQYTSKGSVNGISGSTDLDYFSGGPEVEQTTVNTSASVRIESLNALVGQTVSYTANGLPAGVTMNSSGLITGSPTAIGAYQVTVTSSSSAIMPASVAFTWDVHGTVTMTSPGNRNTVAGSAVALHVAATDSAVGYTPTFTATGLPPGLSISPGGLISGWASTPGTYHVTVRAADSLDASASASFTWTVSQATASGPTGRVVLVNGGKCLDDTGSSRVNGTKIQIWTCNGGAAQKWTLVQDETLRVSGKCLDVMGGGTANGTPVQLWSCVAGNINQRWQVGTGGELVSIESGKCLDDPHARTANGTKLDISSCNGGSNQHWTLPAAPLASEVAGKCLADGGSSRVNGTKIQIWTCNGGAAQNWTAEPDGTVRVFGKCLDVTGHGTASGTKLQLWSCIAGDSAQRWQFAGAGELVNPNSGKCLADPADSAVNGTWTEIETCPSATDRGTSWHMM